MEEVSADKAYSSNFNLVLVGMHNATPYSPFKSNTTGSSASIYWDKLFTSYMYKRDEFLPHYHKRSNVETTFSMIKRKMGDFLRSKTDTALVNEALCKVLAHNLCCVIQSIFEFGIEPTFGNARSTRSGHSALTLEERYGKNS
jgi:transposase